MAYEEQWQYWMTGLEVNPTIFSVQNITAGVNIPVIIAWCSVIEVFVAFLPWYKMNWYMKY